jgi:ABC-type antimicrobial peptide transport system permease subunit
VDRHGQEDFAITSQEDLVSTVTDVSQTLTILLGSIAGISLVVGGIGIMNIMLVSVTERTREIGIRKAVGARRRDILTQFLIEALTVTLLGGAVGVILGMTAAQVANGRTIGSRLTLKTVPEVVFELDQNEERAARIDRLLAQLRSPGEAAP